ncbi:MAG TPA: Spy/CpxP family protein refolding chaperone [Lacunisphaera sp.]|jgi:Spy/CpxP family protein refolding chaperone|nr:Spy/CpxP family protein refolding chaperone [Lacunisphaera sp.]
MKSSLSLLLLVAAPLATRAAVSDYAGEQHRAIKALSEDEITALRAGHGLGLARAAELNDYPGPRHVLDLRAELSLTPAQVDQLTAVFDRMHAAAQKLGRELIAQETALDRLFAEKRATADAVAALTAGIGRLQGELRASHLNAHVAAARILEPAQIARYDELRGYADRPGRP